MSGYVSATQSVCEYVCVCLDAIYYHLDFGWEKAYKLMVCALCWAGLCSTEINFRDKMVINLSLP